MMNGKSLDEVIMSCDKDGNGLIDYNEFKAAMLVDWLKRERVEVEGCCKQFTGMH